MTRALIVALLLACAVAWGLWQRAGRADDRATDLARQVVQLQDQMADLAEARNVARAHYLRIEKQAAERDALLRELLAQEGADAPLSDFLRDGAGRMWP